MHSTLTDIRQDQDQYLKIKLAPDKCNVRRLNNKSSAVAEMGDRGHNRHGPKRGGAVPLSRSAGNPCNTMWPAPMSTSVPSGVFIHPAVWPQLIV